MSESEKNENENESTEENIENIVDNTLEEKGNLLSQAMDLKEVNPKVFFGGIAVIIIALLMIIISLSGNKKLPQIVFKDLSIGQQYVLKGANGINDEKSSISLVTTPGLLAFDDSEEEGKSRPCKQQPEGTMVKVLGFQDFAGKKDAFIQVEILTAGNCLGKKGWVLAIDIQ